MASKRARTSPTAEPSQPRTSSRSFETLPHTAAAVSFDKTQVSVASVSAAPSAAGVGANEEQGDGVQLEGETTTPAVAGNAERGRGGSATTTIAFSSHNRLPPPPEYVREHFPTRFFSWGEFDAYLSELCAATYQIFRKRSSVTAVTHNREFVAHSHKKIPLDMFEFYTIKFQCTHGIPRRSRGVGLRTHAGVRDTGCAACITATVKLDRRINAHFIQVWLAGAHNHPVGREQYIGYTENRRITDPALLRVIETMNARGAPPKDILAQVAAIVCERTGGQCLYLSRDISNVLARLKKEQEQRVGRDALDDSGEEQSSAEADSETDDTDTGRHASGRRKRRAAGTVFTNTVSADGDAATSRLSLLHKKKKSGAKLSRLTVFLDSSYCYNHIRNEITQFDIATMELFPGTISGFAREIFQLTPSEKPDDVDFVLPRYVLTGCESGILEYCRDQRLYPGNVGVRLSVHDPGSDEPRLVTLSSRQLMTMKRFHLVRRVVPDIKKVVDWITSTADLEDCDITGSFDDYADYTKDLFALSLTLLPLLSTTVFGSFHTGSASMQFTDTIIGASILKFGDVESNMDVDCAKAALLSMYSRFGDRASFLKPEFSLEELISENCRKGSAYGAFLTPKRFVAGLVRLQSTRWGAAVLDCSTNTCYLYASNAIEFEELDHAMKCLFKGYKMPEVGFVAQPLSSSLTESLSPQTNDTGILALLFLELTLQSESWMELASIESLDYYRMRYMLQAIQVVTKQNIHDIRWH